MTEDGVCSLGIAASLGKFQFDRLPISDEYQTVLRASL
jgi:hypothetical protein